MPVLQYSTAPKIVATPVVQPYWLPGGVSATPSARGCAGLRMHAMQGSRASTWELVSRKVHSRDRCQYLPYRVVNIAASELGKSLTAGLGCGLIVATPMAPAVEDIRPSRYATPTINK